MNNNDELIFEIIFSAAEECGIQCVHWKNSSAFILKRGNWITEMTLEGVTLHAGVSYCNTKIDFANPNTDVNACLKEWFKECFNHPKCSGECKFY